MGFPKEEYKKLRYVGEGSFANVFKVEHKSLGYVRALKVSKDYIEDEDDKAYTKFIKECKVMLRLGNGGGHPNIIKIYQPRLFDNSALVEMDFIEGRTLHEFITATGFMPLDEIRRFCDDIIGAMAYCHVDVYRYMMNAKDDNLQVSEEDGTQFVITPDKERQLIEKYGVVHNDLHAGNVMRRNLDGNYFLLDFGLAIQNKNAVNSTEIQAGACEYSAPEKLDGQVPTRRSDVYSLGIMMYLTLTGRVPFQLQGKSESAQSRVVQAHKNETAPAIEPLRKAAFEKTHPGEEYKKDYPDELEDVIRRCLSKNPDDRYADAKEMLKALREAFDVFDERNQLREANRKLNEEKAKLKTEFDQGKLQYETLCESYETLQNELNVVLDQLIEIEENGGIPSVTNASQPPRSRESIEHEIEHLKQQLAYRNTNTATANTSTVWKIVAAVMTVAAAAMACLKF